MKHLCIVSFLFASASVSEVCAQPTGSAVALTIANCLLEKAPEQARAFALLKLGQSAVVPKEPCGTVPFPRPKYNFVNSDLIVRHIKDTIAQRVFECAKGTKDFDLIARNFRNEILKPQFQRQLANADRKWQKENSNASPTFPTPPFRRLELAAKLTSAKFLIKSVRQCDAEFVDVNPFDILSLVSPSLGKLDA